MEVPTKNKVIFILLCVFIVIAVILGVLVGSVIFKRESYNKYANYWCDTKWTCCTENNCDSTKAVNDEQGKLLKIDENAIYYPIDMIKQGSAYHQNCVLPVRNAMINYAGATGSAAGFNLQELFGFDASATESAPSYWGVGCTGPGGATGTKCADPAYNPQVQPLCEYAPPDAFYGGEPRFNTMTPSSYTNNPTLPGKTGANLWNTANAAFSGNTSYWNDNQSLTYPQLTNTGWSSNTGQSSWVSTLQGNGVTSNGKPTNENFYNNLLRPEKAAKHYPGSNA